MKRNIIDSLASFLVKKSRKTLVLTLTAVLVAGCGSTSGSGDDVVSVRNDYALSYDDAVEETRTIAETIDATTITPQLDLDAEEVSNDAALADINTYDLTVQGNGEINIEIAAATELSSNAPDDWINIVAKNFNASGQEVNGKSVNVSIRKIASGEVLTYMVDGGYRPQAFIPSNYAWGKMLDASGINTVTVCDRIAGNTAGILISDEMYDTYTEKYGEVTVSGILEAAIEGDLIFAYTNPYTSSTGLNILTAMLYAFDPDNPLSQTATEKLIEYQQNAPTAAYTTGVLRNSAKKGIIDAMVMEEQAYINTPELKSYVFTPAGIRHDHPVYTFDYVSKEEQEAMIKKNPAYGQVICRCETITLGEILEAIHSPLPAVSIDGVKRRTNAGMGRCQGGFCGPKVFDILMKENHLKFDEVYQDATGSSIAVAETKGGAK